MHLVVLLFRHLLQDREDIFRLIKMFAFVAAVLGTCMSYEYLTRVDLFSYLAQHQIVPWVRDGRVRAQGPFGVSITAGIFGADVVTAVFSTLEKWGGKAVGVYWACVRHCRRNNFDGQHSDYRLSRRDLALCLWPIRRQMRRVRWGIVVVVLCLALVMKAPVWFCGSGEHRKRKCL